MILKARFETPSIDTDSKEVLVSLKTGDAYSKIVRMKNNKILVIF